MFRYQGGQWVKNGAYWDTGTWEFVSIIGEGGILPGGPERRFLSVPRPMVIVAGPLIGLGYVIFMPLIGPVLLAMVLGRKLLRYIERGTRAIVEVALPSWVPGASHLLKRNGTPTPTSTSLAEEEDDEDEGALNGLEREITERRGRGEK